MMTSAELKTIRESLGLTVQWLADQAHVRLRTAQYWEAGRFQIPDDVAQMVLDIERRVALIVAETLQQFDEMCKRSGTPDKHVLLRYRSEYDLWHFYPDMEPLPASTHASLLARIRTALIEQGITTVIQYMEPAEYMVWLDGRKDSQTLRALWAGLEDA